MLIKKATLPELGSDGASKRWKESQMNTNKQSVHSQVSAMNAATAQMVTLTGAGEETDHTAVGAAVKTISTNLPEMAKGVQMLAALMDDEGKQTTDICKQYIQGRRSRLKSTSATRPLSLLESFRGIFL